MVSGHCSTLLERVIVCFDTDLASQIKLTKLPVIHCFEYSPNCSQDKSRVTVICCWMSTRVFRKYTKLAMLLFLYCLRGEEQIIFSKKVPLVGIKPGTSCGPL